VARSTIGDLDGGFENNKREVARSTIKNLDGGFENTHGE